MSTRINDTNLLLKVMTSEKLEELLRKYSIYQEEKAQMKSFGLTCIAILFISKWLFLSPCSKTLLLLIGIALLVAALYKSYLLYRSWSFVCNPIKSMAKKENVELKILKKTFNQIAIIRFGGQGI